jgi:hypothetical protein
VCNPSNRDGADRRGWCRRTRGMEVPGNTYCNSTPESVQTMEKSSLVGAVLILLAVVSGEGRALPCRQDDGVERAIAEIQKAGGAQGMTCNADLTDLLVPMPRLMFAASFARGAAHCHSINCGSIERDCLRFATEAATRHEGGCKTTGSSSLSSLPYVPGLVLTRPPAFAECLRPLGWNHARNRREQR